MQALPAAHVQRYTEFGNWRRGCYGQDNMLVTRTNIPMYSNSFSLVLPLDPSWNFDRLWLMEDLLYGQRISAFTLELLENGTAYCIVLCSSDEPLYLFLGATSMGLQLIQ